jgi:hypothetical protein
MDIGQSYDGKFIKKNKHSLLAKKGIVIIRPSWSESYLFISSTGKRSFLTTIDEFCTSFPNGMKIIALVTAKSKKIKDVLDVFHAREPGIVPFPNTCGGINFQTQKWWLLKDSERFHDFLTTNFEFSNQTHSYVKTVSDFPTTYRVCTIGEPGNLELEKHGSLYDATLREEIGNAKGLYAIIPSWSRGMVKIGTSIAGLNNRFNKYCQQMPTGFRVLMLGVVQPVVGQPKDQKRAMDKLEKDMFRCLVQHESSLCRIGANCADRQERKSEWVLVTSMDGLRKLTNSFQQCMEGTPNSRLVMHV